MNAPTIGIIGSQGKMGSAFCTLFREQGMTVLEADLDTELRPSELISQADITIFSVPITDTPGLIEKLAPQAKEGSLLTDFTSIKSPAVKALEEHALESCEILGLHPVFGPSVVADLSGQVFASCPVRSGEYSQWLLEFFRQQGALIKETSAEEHDQMMSVVQGLTHLSSIATAMALKELGISLRESLEFASPIYQLRLDMVGRILSQDPRLYAEIAIENPLTMQSLKAYVEAINQLMKYLSSDDESGFIQAFTEAAEFLGDFRYEAYERTTQLITSSPSAS